MFVIMERSIHATAVLEQVNGALAFELFPPPEIAFLQTRPATALFVVYPKRKQVITLGKVLVPSALMFQSAGPHCLVFQCVGIFDIFRKHEVTLGRVLGCTLCISVCRA